MRTEEFCVALPVHTLTFEATSQQVEPGNEAAYVRVKHRVPDGTCHRDHNFVRAGRAWTPSVVRSWNCHKSMLCCTALAKNDGA